MEEMYNLENSIITRMQYLFITVLLLLLRKQLIHEVEKQGFALEKIFPERLTSCVREMELLTQPEHVLRPEMRKVSWGNAALLCERKTDPARPGLGAEREALRKSDRENAKFL